MCHFNSRTSCEVRPGTLAQTTTIDISTHAPLARCDWNPGAMCAACRFQLTHLLRGATSRYRNAFERMMDFNSRTSCEVRRTSISMAVCGALNFNSRTSCEVRRMQLLQNHGHVISTHAPLARCDISCKDCNFDLWISTHAPLARCDTMTTITAMSA